MREADRPFPVGVVIGSSLPAQEIAPLARLAEELGFSELWLPEDYFLTGGIAGAAVALGATSSIPVGLGIASALVRHPSVLAMETATLSAAYGNRFLPGVGLGAPDWLRQMGLYPKRQLAAVEECVTAIRELLGGGTVTHEGHVSHFREVTLTHAPAQPPPVYCGVMGPKMVELAGRIADGLLIGATAPPQYVSWARERLASGAQAAGRAANHRVPVCVHFSVDHDGATARAAVRPLVSFYLAAVGPTSYTDACGISDDLRTIMAEGGSTIAEWTAAVAEQMPDAWLDDLAVAGTPDECAAAIERHRAAGADAVVLTPLPMNDMERVLRLAAVEVLPRLTDVRRAA